MMFQPKVSLALTLFVLAGTQAIAQEKKVACVAGTVDGKCVSPFVAHLAIGSAIAYTQANISVSGHPYPASLDTTYAYPNNVTAYPPITQRQNLIGGFGTRGLFENRLRGE